MAEEEFSGEKTEQPTPRKREEARSKGQIARSQDLSTAILLVVAFTLIRVMSTGVVEKSLSVVRLSFERISTFGPQDEITAIEIASLAVLWVLQIVLPIVAVFFAVAFLVGIFQAGWRVSTKSITPDIQKLDPIKGIKRIVSIRGIMKLSFGILKLAIVAIVAVISYGTFIGSDSTTPFRALLELEFPSAVQFMFEATSRIGLQASVALLILAILDYAYQKWQFEKDLRMTKQEVKEEQKRMEGDPRIKQKRRAIGQQLALRQIAAEVPKADVVITNPTHYSIALRYDQDSDAAPVVVAKGVDHLALKIREIAKEHDIPIVEEPPLARSLHATTEVGEPVPADLYEPVARVLAYVFKLGRRSRKTRQTESAVN